ncbi:MAG: glucosyltransferase [Lachnospiraceae bacterium]|nr:glucosyltransferase [Lachnospiraceae bacterium]
MSRIVFFCIPAHGHTNPTIEVVRELVKRGNTVRYYSFEPFKDKIEEAGAEFIACEKYLPELRKQDEKKIGKDFSALMDMVMSTTENMEETVYPELCKFHPDAIVSDSMCGWGKLFAKRMKAFYICSTTTFAFNRYTARLMKQNFLDIFRMMVGMRSVNKKIGVLKEKGYEINSMLDIIQNDNETNTIVFTSKEFQPMVETFSDRYYFVGPSIPNFRVEKQKKKRPLIYISLGTVNNKNSRFYENCIKAFGDQDMDVIMSVGEQTDIASLGEIPANFEVKNRVIQTAVLQRADVFVTHCGMNSVNESLYYGVPMVLFPQQSEQGTVAMRTKEMGAGELLKKNSPEAIKKMVYLVLHKPSCKEKAEEIGESFRNAGGAKKAADAIEKMIAARPIPAPKEKELEQMS